MSENEAPEQTEQVETTDAESSQTDSWGEDFDAERAKSTITNLRQYEKQAKQLQKELDAAKAQLTEAKPVLDEYQALKKASQTDVERFQADLTAEAEARAAAEATANSYRDRAVKAEAKAIAATSFADAEDAIALLGNLDGYVEDGEIDTEKLSTDLGNLLKRKPYLGRVEGDKRMRPNPAQGQSGAASLTPLEVAAQMESGGDFKSASAVKADQLLALARKNK